MKLETIEKIFNFIKEKEGMDIPLIFLVKIEKLKFIEELENHPYGIQYKHKGDLNLSYSKITKLPNDLYVVRSLVLYDCQQLTKLPDNLYVGGDLNLFNCRNITELPNKLYVEGFFIIIKTKLANKYSDEEIYEMVRLGGGEIKGDILR